MLITLESIADDLTSAMRSVTDLQQRMGDETIDLQDVVLLRQRDITKWWKGSRLSLNRDSVVANSGEVIESRKVCAMCVVQCYLTR